MAASEDSLALDRLFDCETREQEDKVKQRKRDSLPCARAYIITACSAACGVSGRQPDTFSVEGLSAGMYAISVISL